MANRTKATEQLSEFSQAKKVRRENTFCETNFVRVLLECLFQQ